MKRAGFILDTEGNIKKHTTEGVEYVHFYKDDHIIPIPYEFFRHEKTSAPSTKDC